MRTDQIFNKPVLVNFTYDYAGTIYKLIASGNSGEIQFALVENKPSGKMFILPLDKIVSITDDYIVIDNRKSLADFELFQEMAKGEYLILDETTANRADIDKIMERRVPAAKTGAAGSVSYLSFMQPEIQPEPAGVGASYAGASKSGALKPHSVNEGWRPQTETGFYRPDGADGPADRSIYFAQERQRIMDEETRLRDREERLRLNEELMRNEGLRQAQEAERLKEEAARIYGKEQLIAQREEKLRSAEESFAERDKNISVTLASKSEEHRRLESNVEREKAALQELMAQREAVSRELEQMRAKADQDARMGQGKEDINISRLFMLQEERLKKYAQAAQPQTNAQVSPPQTAIRAPQPQTGMQAAGLQAENRDLAAEPGRQVSDMAWELKPTPDTAREMKPVSEPKQEPSPDPGGITREHKAERDNADMIQAYINKQRAEVIGKTIKINIIDEVGNILVNAGTVITDRVFDDVCARRKDAVIELAMFAE